MGENGGGVGAVPETRITSPFTMGGRTAAPVPPLDPSISEQGCPLAVTPAIEDPGSRKHSVPVPEEVSARADAGASA